MAKAFYIPSGTLNLSQLFPTIDFSQVAEIFVELLDTDDEVVATTPLSVIQSCDDKSDLVRIHFLNSLGAIDTINFKRIKKEFEAKSETRQRPIAYPLDRTAHSIERTNVKGNDIVTVYCKDYTEDDMDWINELVSSPAAWVEKPGRQGLPTTLVPILIQDKRIENVKEDNRYLADITLEYVPSHSQFIIRN